MILDTDSCTNPVSTNLIIHGHNMREEIKDGDVETDNSFFSTTASDATATQSTASQSEASSDEYDDFPKIGDSFLVFWLLSISAICLAGRYALKKTALNA